MADNNIDLLCCEETKSLCFDDGDLVENGEKNIIHFGSDSEPLFNFLPLLSEECINWMIERENKHLPRNDYLKRLRSGELDMSLRREALDWMFKACSHHNFGELCLYLAMNYLDRFLSAYNLPGGKTWAIQLVAVACLSLAAKMEEAGEPKFLFEGKTIQRMEIVVLNYLKWNVKAYTPFNFIDYFLKKMNDDDVEFPPRSLISRSIQIILITIKGIDFLEFRPSEIAAAVAIYVSGEIQTVDIDKALSSSIGVEKGRVVKCFELIKDLISRNVGNGTVSSSVPHSPNGVLEAATCLSYKSGDERTVGSCPTSSHTSPDTKRRKLEQQEL
ncbi:hypothetical protein BUALT_Bualt11G0022800 [Buddleja alternifolia]|uniref:Cyclin D2 n=1 Tax=Buddleja alternifolia TaxID=168488 RepID=A0AAV6WRZ3_9LAMI|nr:hypothetical protein BUALT_Bualt11G0022800 [Buddleja alternifolia]